MLGLIFLLLVGGFLAMLGTLGYQAYLYLKHGEWVEISVTFVCGSPPLEWQWCNFPQDWLGLHKLLSDVNAGAFAFLLGAVLTWAVAMALEGNTR